MNLKYLALRDIRNIVIALFTGRGERIMYNLGFGYVSSVSLSINDQKCLRGLWQSQRLSFTDILKRNFLKIIRDREDYVPILTPEIGFSVKSSNIEMTKKLININIEMPEPSLRLNNEKEKYFTAAGIIINEDTADKKNNELNITTVEFSSSLIQNKESLRLTVSITPKDKRGFFEFERTKIYLVLVTLDENKNPLNYSKVIKEENLYRIN